MLDDKTRRRIDTARDILVGKVPDPKSQVEQITIALIYKFMDDLDAESEELGGERKFFAGDFARYGWAKLMRSGLGGYEVLNLYAEAITKMPENPGIPSLFRDIFKNAYLPYRDPETLRIFLKVIDEFKYDHSERLGDAFEYLLSVLGSQGDAGQFRTPRDLIDFIVDIVDPKKNEVVLDPACGTAGFLIASYKHILEANTDANSRSTLTPDERGRLATNFRGYDISPDMVRLSLVNMYLHGFADPHIYEYDTLTSLDRWNEYADVILANPPFMSPKGGIRPHNRFSVQSKRSEVLFVDYMAEHLAPNGRAGIVVPEGILFQAGSAYRQLRQLLIQDFLVAVISLPSGVFQPYTAVKTSVLIFDKSEVRKNTKVLFCDVRNIGVSLGIRRIPIDQNDLPKVLTDIRAFYRGQQISAHSWAVDRQSLLANGCMLSGERYRPSRVLDETRRAKLGEICRFTKGRSSSTRTPPGQYPLVVRGGERLTSADYQFDGSAVCVPLLSLAHGRGQIKRVHYAEGKFALANLLVAVEPSGTQIIDVRFLHLVLQYAKDHLAALMQGAIYMTLKIEDLARFEVPVPRIEVQRQIVAEIEGHRKVIDGARAVVENYRPRIAVDPTWPLEKLGRHFATKSGGTPSKSEPGFWVGDIPWISPKDMKADLISDTQDHISAAALEDSSTRVIPAGSVVCVVRSGILKHSFPVALLDRDMCINQDLVAFEPTTGDVTAKFLFYVFKTNSAAIIEKGIKLGVTVQSFHSGFLRDYPIPVPPLGIQESVVAEIEAEQALVAANYELIECFEEKIQRTLARVWGDEDFALATD